MQLRLQKYDINLSYIQGKLLKGADTLSRPQLSQTAEEISNKEMRSQIHLIYANLPCFDEILAEVHQETSQDPVSQQVIRILRRGWPQSNKALLDNPNSFGPHGKGGDF